MKKIISFYSILLLALCAGRSQAQVTLSPASFLAEDEVTITVDVSGTPLAGEAAAYIWIFANTGLPADQATTYPAKDGSTNTDWGNSPAAAAMTSVGTNKWSFKFTGTTMFNLPPGQLKNFGFLIKTKSGSKQTPDYKPYNFDPLIFTPAKLRIFPAKVDRDDIVNMLFQRTLATTLDEQRMTPVSALVTAYDETGAQVGQVKTFPARKAATDIWSAAFVPSDNFTPAAGHKLNRFVYHFSGTVVGPSNTPVTVTTSDAEALFVDMK